MHWLLLMIGVLTGCAALPTGQHASAAQPPLTLHTWLLPECPSSRGENALADSLLSGVLVSAADSVIDWMGDALAQAAKEDRDGRATLGSSPAYLWWMNAQTKGRGLMSCAVIALTRSSPAHWCDEAAGAFSTTAPGVCRYFAADRSPGNPAATLQPANWSGSSLPALYAEIRLEAASDHRGVLPRLETLYYPRGIHGGQFADARPRTLQLGLAAATPEGAKALGSVVIRIDGAVPAAEVQHGDQLPRAATGVWAAALAIPERYRPPESGGPIMPVNVSAEVREVGAPDRFLQALAAAFAAQRVAVKDYLTTGVSPARR